MVQNVFLSEEVLAEGSALLATVVDLYNISTCTKRPSLASQNNVGNAVIGIPLLQFMSSTQQVRLRKLPCIRE